MRRQAGRLRPGGSCEQTRLTCLLLYLHHEAQDIAAAHRSVWSASLGSPGAQHSILYRGTAAWPFTVGRCLSQQPAGPHARRRVLPRRLRDTLRRRCHAGMCRHGAGLLLRSQRDPHGGHRGRGKGQPAAQRGGLLPQLLGGAPLQRVRLLQAGGETPGSPAAQLCHRSPTGGAQPCTCAAGDSPAHAAWLYGTTCDAHDLCCTLHFSLQPSGILMGHQSWF